MGPLGQVETLLTPPHDFVRCQPYMLLVDKLRKSRGQVAKA